MIKIPVTEEIRDCFLTSQDTIKLSTLDGKLSWDAYKTQFSMAANANGWDTNAKAFHLACLLRGDAANILQTLTEEEKHNYG